ncbi:MAG: N-6 DNA methylase [Gallionella sp.]|nr:N-6 DNA methylase [Gallionella sp.]
MPTPQAVLTLVENFERNLDAYRSGKYNETQVRRDFIDPLFKALGWDMDNSAGYAEAYRDVIHEDAIKIGASTKAPDYSFRVGGQRKFFLEAKKPSVNVKDDVEPAFQLRRYAWSAKLPLSIVTDFEEFAIYDCRAKPDKGDKASKARLFYCTFRDYAAKWDEIAAIFSKEAVLKGSFDKYAGTSKGKRGTSEVDSAFLEEIEGWRDLLARNIALRNGGVGAQFIAPESGKQGRDESRPYKINLSQRELNFAVQQTIDRIIFLRICEDRGIEPYGKLMALQNGVNVYGRLREMFRDADDRYNSGLFHFKREKGRAEAPDELTLNLEIDDKPLKEIFKNLYYPDCPYEFSVLGADILGSVYEQFLGKVIRLTAGNRAVVEDKPEVKKAGGVFYTPAYIVQYIVAHTVGKLLEGKTPKQTAGIAILDPACGSGSFLIGAYQYLLDWYLARYVEEGTDKHGKGKAARIHPAAHGAWRLTTAEKKRILLEHIYGVDIDTQAVEVTKLSLLLKMLEGESNESLNSQMKLFHERVLPDLERNIQCGNSLIGPDFYDGQLALDDEAAQRINVFDWQASFPQIFKAGGFDAVIGNPPYVRQESLAELKPYLQDHYTTSHGTADLYVYFIERGVSLLKQDGVYGMIVANKWMRVGYGEPLRCWMKQQRIENIVDFTDMPVFKNATTYTCILQLRKNEPLRAFVATQVRTLDFPNLEEYVSNNRYQVIQSMLDDRGWSLADGDTLRLQNKLASLGIALRNYVNGAICYGVKTGYNEAFVIDQATRDKIIAEDFSNDAIIKPFLVGRDIKRYQTPSTKQYVLFTRHGIDIKKYPAIECHLLAFKDGLVPKPKNWKGDTWKGRKPGDYQWYEIQDTVDYYLEFDKPKILWPGISAEVAAFSLDESGSYGNDNTQMIISGERYLLGILNSRLMRFFLKQVCDRVQGGFYRLKIAYVQQLPIRAINFSDPSDSARHDKLDALVEKMLALHQQLATAKTPQDTTLLQRQIDAADKQIDQLVYALYGLTDEEIALVEGA